MTEGGGAGNAALKNCRRNEGRKLDGRRLLGESGPVTLYFPNDGSVGGEMKGGNLRLDYAALGLGWKRDRVILKLCKCACVNTSYQCIVGVQKCITSILPR